MSPSASVAIPDGYSKPVAAPEITALAAYCVAHAFTDPATAIPVIPITAPMASAVNRVIRGESRAIVIEQIASVLERGVT